MSTAIHTVEKQLIVPARTPGVRMLANSYYTRAVGVEKVRYLTTQSRSDTTDSIERSFSTDNGVTWSDPEQQSFVKHTPAGTLRRGPRPGFVDPVRDRVIRVVVEALLPGDQPLEGLTTRTLHYEVSADGARTFPIAEQIIVDGAFDASHPIPGVRYGWSSANVGDQTCRPIRTTSGTILIPFQICPYGSDRKIYNPGGGHTYGQAAVLITRWRGERFSFRMSEPVKIDPNVSTRGLLEPTLAELTGERILMVMRGSNDAAPELPGRKWFALSGDGGETWTYPAPWSYTDGEPFYSPSSCSQLVPHSSGRLFWIGNITSENPCRSPHCCPSYSRFLVSELPA